MKFKITTVLRDNPERNIIEMDGELDAVKTYLKLRIKAENFKWGVVERTDDMLPGDVSRWAIKRTSTYNRDSDSYDFGLTLNVFSLNEVDPIINVNAMMAAFTDRQSTYETFKPINKLLGGGKF